MSSPGRSDDPRQALGRLGEAEAAALLERAGLRIVARRFRRPWGEIDLIAETGDLVVFVEVKARRDLAAAMEAVSGNAQRRIEAAADHWLSRQPDFARLSVRFDLVAVLPRRWPVHMENFFQGRN